MTDRGSIFAAAALAALLATASPALAQKNYDPGVTDTEIELGTTAPFSGPVSMASTVAKSLGAYFDKINAEEGGVNGSKIKLLALDDGYSPPRTVAQTRKRIEDEQVLLIVDSVGTPTQLAERQYVNDCKLPQLLPATGANVLFAFATQKTAVQAIPHAAEIDWKPKIFIPSIVRSNSQVREPAGIDNAKGVITTTYVKDPTSPHRANDKGAQVLIAWIGQYDTAGHLGHGFAAAGGYMVGQLTVHILKAAGDNLTRENILNQATHLHDVVLPMLIPGIFVNTSPTDDRSIKRAQFQYFDGRNFVPTGDIVWD